MSRDPEKIELLDTLNDSLLIAIKLVPLSVEQLSRVDFSTLIPTLERALKSAKQLER